MTHYLYAMSPYGDVAYRGWRRSIQGWRRRYGSTVGGAVVGGAVVGGAAVGGAAVGGAAVSREGRAAFLGHV